MNPGDGPGAALALEALVAATGLAHERAGRDGFVLPIPGGRRRHTEVTVSRLADGIVRVKAPLDRLPTRWGRPRGRAFIFERLLQATRRASYAKAVSAGPDAIAFAADLPAAVLNGRLLRGLVLELASLADIRSGQLLSAGAWENSRIKAAQALADHVAMDARTSAQAAIAALRAAGLEVEDHEGHSILAWVDHPDASFAASVEADESGISLIVFPSWQVRAPVRGERFMAGLLELNRAAQVAKVGIDGEGDVVLFHQLPTLDPGVLPQARDSLVALLLAVEAFDQSGSWR